MFLHCGIEIISVVQNKETKSYRIETLLFWYALSQNPDGFNVIVVWCELNQSEKSVLLLADTRFPKLLGDVLARFLISRPKIESWFVFFLNFFLGWVPATGLRIRDGVAVNVGGVEESRTCVFTSSRAFNIDSHRAGGHRHKKTILHWCRWQFVPAKFKFECCRPLWYTHTPPIWNFTIFIYLVASNVVLPKL